MDYWFSSRSHFSIGLSTLTPADIVEAAKKNGYKHVALTDVMTVSGLNEFFKACKEHEIHGLIGVAVNVYEDPTYRKPSKKSGEVAKENPWYQIKLFPQDEQGMRHIFALLTRANQEDYFYGEPRVGLKDVLEQLRKGHISVTSGDVRPVFVHDDADAIIKEIKTALGNEDSFAVEMIAADSAFYRRVNQLVLDHIKHTPELVLYSRPALHKPGRADSRDMLQWICNDEKPTRNNRTKVFHRDFQVLDSVLMEKLVDKVSLFPGIAGVSFPPFNATIGYEFRKQPISLPKMAADDFHEMTKQCKEGWHKRIDTEVFGFKPDKADHKIYSDRLRYELGVLRKMNFAPYFLLVSEIVNWCKSNGIAVGPARGSAAGSLVAYLMGITDVDPIRFNLIFERFLNPERLDYPDIDLDFMSSRRQEVITYLINKYGEDRVAGIANYSTLGSASALREVGRMLGLPEDDYSCSKFVPKEHGQNVALEGALTTVSQIEEYAIKYPEAWKTSCELQGVMRNLARHAAGVIVAGAPLQERSVVERRSGEATVNWDKQVVEDWGLIKLDVLGLSTLDVLRICVDKIKLYTGKDIDLLSLPLDDAGALGLFQTGETKGIFQFEGGMAVHLTKEIGAGGSVTFEDLVAVNALNRPGPLDAGLDKTYVRIRQGLEKPDYIHPLVKPALESTYGVLIYQEQVMQMARDLSGFTMPEADKLRKAIGKKDADLMSKMRDKFITGAVDNGMPAVDASQLWNIIEGFAAYSFNRSHAVAYSLISYQCAWLKFHYPAEFYAASLTVLGEDKLKPIAREAARRGIMVKPPDINESGETFMIGYDHARACKVLYAPFSRIKGISENGVKAIIAARLAMPGQRFNSRKEFEDNVQRRLCNIRAIESLDKVGAFAQVEPGQQDSLHPDRLRDQKELMPGLSLQEVKSERRVEIDGTVAGLIKDLYDELNSKVPAVHPLPTYGKRGKADFVVVTDCPAYSEEQDVAMFSGKSSEYLKAAMKEAGVKPSTGYYTALVKRKKADKQLSNEEILTYSPYTMRELEILNSPVVVLCGGGAIRHFFPEVKGGWQELVGQIHYDPKRDCNFVFGCNPQMVYANAAAHQELVKVFKQVLSLIE